jgi:quercetin dioxygenase-like cupin family protein/phenylpyruvate tautomerase PptA (4-oxalocrotonate tautomerase family)
VPGKSERQKTRLADAIAKNVIHILRYGEESVPVAMEEIKPQDWRRRSTDPTSSATRTIFTTSPDTTRVTCNRRGYRSFKQLGERKMEIKRAGSQPSASGLAEWFTGTVRVDPILKAPDPAFVESASVTFEPRARTAWHTHPLGQALIVTAGCGRAQHWGGPVEEIHPGDVIWFSPGEKHWHGAAPTTAMTHIAIQERFNGSVVDWMEHVSDEQYRK